MLKAELLSLLTLLSRHFGEKTESGGTRRRLIKLQPDKVAFSLSTATPSEADSLLEYLSKNV